MMRTTWSRAIWLLAAVCLLVACAPKPEAPVEEAPPPPVEQPAATAEVPEPLPDPGPEEATEVEEHVRSWVAERADEGVYAIPPRGGHEVSGTLGAFHTVHQKDADTYSVCVDFEDGENVYDVDFFVDRSAEGLAVSEHYLHKINGEAVE